MNIIDYLKWRGDLSFDIVPFNEVDNLILANTAYIRFTDLIDENDNQISLHDAAKAFLSLDKEKRISRIDYDIEFLNILMNTKRFRDIKVFRHRELYDEEKEMQFGAMTFEIGHNLYYVSYRGTDSFLAGWKEDFDMSYSIVKAQEMALEYLKSLINTYKKGHFLIGGHSKGGNLAVFASAFLTDRELSRIDFIYNNDGPGFDFEVMPLRYFERLTPKMITFTPATSIVGSFFDSIGKIKVIDDNDRLLLGHDPYNWQVEADHFIYKDSVNDLSANFKTEFDSWIKSLSYSERRQVIEELYRIIRESKATTLENLIPSLVSNWNNVLVEISKMDKKTGRAVRSAISVIINTFRLSLDDKAQKLLNRNQNLSSM